jgi:glyoxylase-like metal-dependent hydrolase (beta-lactamase superfamily II)
MKSWGQGRLGSRIRKVASPSWNQEWPLDGKQARGSAWEQGSTFKEHLLKADDCTLVEIEQQIPGFDRFIGAWVYRGKINLVVDVGPAHSVHHLIAALTEMDMDRVDYVLLTHIHIDHAGGVARFLEHFPMARVVCHEKGKKHVVEPSKLWEGSRKVLGEIADAFGPPEAVKEERCLAHTEVDIEGLTVVETPGHASHHLSFSYGGHLFSGEAAGNYYAVGETDYLRPATPPRFFLKVFLGSLDRLAALEDQHICYSHFGDAPSSRPMLERFRAQIFRWKQIVGEEMSRGPDDLIGTCVDSLLERDPDLRAFQVMDLDTQKRERVFMSNSVRGYVDFLQNQG